ncbi:MAG: SIS domain-containing protein [Candidatus Aminicenantes bacterium]
MDYMNAVDQVYHISEIFFSSRKKLYREAVKVQLRALRQGGKILVFGNGGSASQSQHYAAELVNTFLEERAAIPAVSLTTDTSALTSIANDRGHAEVFARQAEALGKPGDAAVALSTSGNSESVIKAVRVCAERGIATVALTGEGGGRLAEYPDVLLDVPSKSTPRIQEVHLLLLHLMAEEIEKAFL